MFYCEIGPGVIDVNEVISWISLQNLYSHTFVLHRHLCGRQRLQHDQCQFTTGRGNPKALHTQLFEVIRPVKEQGKIIRKTLQARGKEVGTKSSTLDLHLGHHNPIPTIKRPSTNEDTGIKVRYIPFQQTLVDRVPEQNVFGSPKLSQLPQASTIFHIVFNFDQKTQDQIKSTR